MPAQYANRGAIHYRSEKYQNVFSGISSHAALAGVLLHGMAAERFFKPCSAIIKSPDPLTFLLG
ncbi:MAG: hypothetical protein Q7V05_05085 [Methanoregula sp.]|nr:hypothetical protein [Methanoregula sp.]